MGNLLFFPVNGEEQTLLDKEGVLSLATELIGGVTHTVLTETNIINPKKEYQILKIKIRKKKNSFGITPLKTRYPLTVW